MCWSWSWTWRQRQGECCAACNSWRCTRSQIPVLDGGFAAHAWALYPQSADSPCCWCCFRKPHRHLLLHRWIPLLLLHLLPRPLAPSPMQLHTPVNLSCTHASTQARTCALRRAPTEQARVSLKLSRCLESKVESHYLWHNGVLVNSNVWAAQGPSRQAGGTRPAEGIHYPHFGLSDTELALQCGQTCAQ